MNKPGNVLSYNSAWQLFGSYLYTHSHKPAHIKGSVASLRNTCVGTSPTSCIPGVAVLAVLAPVWLITPPDPIGPHRTPPDPIGPLRPQHHTSSHQPHDSHSFSITYTIQTRLIIAIQEKLPTSMRQYVPYAPQPDESEIVVLCRYYCVQKGNPSYRKRVSWLVDTSLCDRLLLSTLGSLLMSYLLMVTVRTRLGGT